VRYGIKLRYSGYTISQLCFKYLERITREEKRADLNILKFIFGICSAYSQTPERTFNSIIMFFNMPLYYFGGSDKAASLVKDFEDRSGYKLYIKKGMFKAVKDGNEFDLWEFSSFRDPILKVERIELDRLYEIEHLFDEFKHNKPASKRSVTWLNACQLCGKYGVPTKVTWRGGIYQWARMSKNEYCRSKDILCMGCWNKVKPLAKIKDEAEENKTLINKLKRAITKKAKENG